MHFSQSPVISVLRQNNFLSTFFSEALILCFPANIRKRKLHVHKEEGVKLQLCIF